MAGRPRGTKKTGGRQKGTGNKRNIQLKKAIEDFSINFLMTQVSSPAGKAKRPAKGKKGKKGKKKTKPRTIKKTRLQNMYERLYKKAMQDGDVKAAQEILDRAYGKPKAFVNYDDSTSISDVTKEEIDELHKRMVKK